MEPNAFNSSQRTSRRETHGGGLALGHPHLRLGVSRGHASVAWTPGVCASALACPAATRAGGASLAVRGSEKVCDSARFVPKWRK